jgi:hypothetical protein
LEVEEDNSSSNFHIFRGDRPEAGWDQIPDFEGNFFGVPGPPDWQLRMDWEDISPRMDELKEWMHDKMQDLNNPGGNVEKAVRTMERTLRIRAV